MKYDIIHFEALGEEAKHLKSETLKAIENNFLPKDLKYLIVPETIQEFLGKNTDVVLPEIITIKTHSILPTEYLNGRKKSIITRSAGYDHLEYLQDKMNIASLREYCVNAVAQTAIKFLYAACGHLNEYSKKAKTFERNDVTSFMEMSKTRVATVFGVGKIGKKVYDLLKANDLQVKAVDFREEDLKKIYGNEMEFISKEEAIKISDIIVNVMNLTTNKNSPLYNVNYFSDEFFSEVKEGLIFINVTRGDIAPEKTLLTFYKKGVISGIGLDVFSDEDEFSNLLRNNKEVSDDNLKAAKEIVDKALKLEENFYVQPHQGFNSDLAVRNKAMETIKHLCNWYKNKKQNFDEQLPYYFF